MLTEYEWNDWARFKKVMLLMFGTWLAVFFVTHTFMKWLNKFIVPLLDLPLGSYIPVQAAMIVFAVALFCFVRATRYAR
jgi:putative solute:sodium symporter small subunit